LMELFTVLEMDSRPPLIMIEEPENFVHPGIMENLAESFERATETAQILVTTHSPFLLNRLSPENVIVVEKIDGETKIHQALDREGVREAANRLGLGDLWISGGIGGTP
ncbi:MAG: ATP-binding protein, partial [Thermoplasmata archaeon]|nr:ATP-binding protein [Thermoplasmata archaeon]